MRKLLLLSLLLWNVNALADENTWKHAAVGAGLGFGISGAFFVLTGQEFKWTSGVIGLVATNVISFAHEGMDAGERALPLDKGDLAVTGAASLAGVGAFWLLAKNRDVVVGAGPQGTPGLTLGFRY